MGSKFTHIKNKYKNQSKSYTLGAKKAFAIFALFLIPGVVFANPSLDRRIQETESALSQTRVEKRTLSQEVASFDYRIANIQSQINKTRQEISSTKNKIATTQKEIKETEEAIIVEKAKLSEIIKVSYENGQASTLEIIAKSKSFSDFVNRAEYLETIQVKIKESADKMNELKRTLENREQLLVKEKERSEALLRDQGLQKQAIDFQRAAKNLLLEKTKGQESEYQKTLENLRAYREWLNSQSGGGQEVTGGSGGYPWASSCFRCGRIDSWSFFTRECTSYAAWRSSISGPISGSMLKKWGSTETANGGDWSRLAVKYNLKTSRIPKANSIMVFPASRVGGVGHVAYVDSVNPNGTVNISEYNWNEDGRFGRRTEQNPFFWSATFIIP